MRYCLQTMAWAKPLYHKAAVDQAGRILIDSSASPAARSVALGVIGNWRSSHGHPLNTFQMTLRNKVKQVSDSGLVAQRMKRLSSIESKLRRFDWLTLSEMQDMAGCRAIVNSVQRVRGLVRLYKGSRLQHVLDDQDDYITNPKPSGYRGYHLIYRYRSDRDPSYDGLKVEMQIRSRLQHAWATAVETVDTFQLGALKAGQGEKDWRRFFALMGGAIALREKAPPVPRTPTTQHELVVELRDYVARLHVEQKLLAYGAALRFNPQDDAIAKGAKYYLLHLEQNTTALWAFKDLKKASEQYLDLETRTAGRPEADVVLVSVESVAALRRAYPNYFLDTRAFVNAVMTAIA
ncbi:MAG: RelA/SpoT domain-containing protein [Candidatus Eisenbacteria bacterium]